MASNRRPIKTTNLNRIGLSVFEVSFSVLFFSAVFGGEKIMCWCKKHCHLIKKSYDNI